MATQRKDSMRMKKCQICGKDAQFVCGGCDAAFYCSQDHQREHWKRQHRTACKKKDQQLTATKTYGTKNVQRTNNIIQLRKQYRKNYYESFSVEKYQECLVVVKLLEQAEQKHLELSSNRFDEFEYGATVCLLIRTYLILGEKMTAKFRLQSYLRDNRILHDMSMLPKRNNPTPETRQFLQKKLSLISTLANLSYTAGLPCIHLYVMYTQNVQTVFGQQSMEASNCYFLVGCYYAQEGHLLKAIACFKRAAQIRGEEAGQCYFNMGVLYKRLGKNNRAIEMFNKALVKRCEFHGDFANEVAQVHQNIGITYMEQFDFKTAMSFFQSAYMIRKSDPMSPEYKRLVDLIVFLYRKLDAYINSGTINIEKPEIFIHLKETIKLNAKLQEDVHGRLMEEDSRPKEAPQDWKEEFDKRKHQGQFQFDPNNFMKIPNFNPQAGLPSQEAGSKPEEKKPQKVEVKEVQENAFRLNIKQQFIGKLSSFQTYHLSQLQLELQDCTTQYRAIVTANNSKFLRVLDKDRAKQFRDANPHIFGQVHISNQKPAVDDQKKKKVTTPKLDLTKAALMKDF